jgi:nucleotide-binding universal stress UspA family protein
MNKYILVPLDGSRLAEMSLPHAVALAHATRSVIKLLRCVPPVQRITPIHAGVPSAPLLQQQLEEAQPLVSEYLAAIADRLHADEGLAVSTVVLEGEPGALIVRYVEQHPEVHLIAMATHGRSGVSRLVFGSVAEKVLHSSPVPILLVRPEVGDGGTLEPSSSEYRKLLVPLDGSPFAEHALEQAETLAAELGTTLVLLTVESPLPPHDTMRAATGFPGVWGTHSDGSKHAMDYLDATARGLRHIYGPYRTVETQVSYGGPAHKILEVALESGADMIVMSTHGRSGVQGLLLGSVALRVVRGTTLPVLLVRAKERVEAPEAKRRAATLAHQACF